jgi:hypothetical protein
MNISIVSKTTIGRKKHPFIHPPMNFKTFYMGVMVVTWWMKMERRK